MIFNPIIDAFFTIDFDIGKWFGLSVSVIKY